MDDIVRQAATYFTDAADYDPDAVAKQWKDRVGTAAILRGVRDAIAAVPAWEQSVMEEALRTLAEQLGCAEKAGKIFQPLRVALTGVSASPGIFEVLELLGRDRSLARIDAALAFIREKD